MQTLIAKYWMPRSLTWWTGIATFLSGMCLLLAGSILPQLAVLTPALNVIWQGMPPAALIAAGLTAIGFRSAVAANAEKIIEAIIASASKT